MNITSANTIRQSILGKNGIPETLKFLGHGYIYKTIGGRYYYYSLYAGNKIRISKASYNIRAEKR